MNNFTNASNSTTDRDVELLKQTVPVIVVFAIVYFITFAFCVVGNTIICLVIVKIPRMRNVTNCFILNLAVSDLLVAVFCMPFTLVDDVVMGWPFGPVMCKITPAVQVVSVAVSVFTLVAIAIDRYCSVIYPNEPSFISNYNVHVIVLIWLLGSILSIPHFVVMQEVPAVDLEVTVCTESWWNGSRKPFTTTLLVVLYIAPLCLIVYLYFRIGCKVWCKPIPGGSREAGLKKKFRVIKMLFVVVMLFALSWIPLHTIMMLDDYGNLQQYQQHIVYYYIYPVSHWLVYMHSSVNPIIYGYYNSSFRKGMTTLMSSMCRENKMTTSAGESRKPDDVELAAVHIDSK
ncbi:neuropeptide FF receptor 2-like [Branchiostoma floridae]|uniref:Neuropeptide FF receptor 2-like n=1 Tax=Branchiostoma floridae TaxID=7739 RepID=C3Z4K8_BRAFL|nr:neuropeptide FF receptor 2-like [Branchiostoma floridae]|eukprot:XP_002596502.1 hypothetical protein BRAFLDRAFT_73824 [Branchiostoma floridae]